MSNNRTVILHYHLFKNAGTSVDFILKSNFADLWATREFPVSGSNNTAMVEDWIRDSPDTIAFSSHTMVGPLPQVDGVRVVSFLLLRDPINRIRSAYRFERQQTADTWGAKLAKEHDFEGYVRARLARSGDRQCRNFQAHRLSTLMPGPGTELQRALSALKVLTIVGSVETFDETLSQLQCELAAIFPKFALRRVQANETKSSSDTMSDEVLDLLRAANQDDLQVCAAVDAMTQKEMCRE